MPRKLVFNVINNLFKEFLKSKEDKGLSFKTLINYAYNLQNFENWFSEKYQHSIDICNITSKDFVEYQNYLIAKNYSLATISLYRQVLLQFLKWCHENGLNINATKFPVAFKIDKLIPNALNKSEYKAFHEAIQKDGNPKYRALLFLYLEAGLTLSEALNLKVEDLELFLNKGWAIIMGVKGKQWGGVPLNYTVTLALKEYIKKEGIISGYLFRGRNNKPMSGRNAQIIVIKYVKAAGIKRNFSPSILRHTYVINLIKTYPALPACILTRLARKKIFKDLMGYTEPSKDDLLDVIEYVNIKDSIIGGK